MSQVTISEAARLTGKARSTIQRDIKKGKVSKNIDENGKPKIDVAELQRVYGALRHPTEETATDATVSQSEANATHELEMLQLQLTNERERREKAEAENDRLLKIVEAQTRLLEAPKQDEAPKGKFVRWFLRN